MCILGLWLGAVVQSLVAARRHGGRHGVLNLDKEGVDCGVWDEGMEYGRVSWPTHEARCKGR